MQNNDQKNLDLLAVFHYIVAGLTALFACFPVIHVIIGFLMATGNLPGEGSPPPPAMGWIFIVAGMGVMLIGWTMAVMVLIAGRKLSKRQSRVFCMVIAGLECMFMPFGTVLGVFTIVLLNKDSIIEIFNASASNPVPSS